MGTTCSDESWSHMWDVANNFIKTNCAQHNMQRHDFPSCLEIHSSKTSLDEKNTQAYHRQAPADQQVWIQNILALKAFCLTAARGCLLYITVVSLRKAQQWWNEDCGASFCGRRFVNCELLGAAAQSLTQTLNCSLWCWLTLFPRKDDIWRPPRTHNDESWHRGIYN